MLSNKTNLHKFKSTEIIQRMFSSHNRSKLEIIKKNFGKYPSMWKVKNIPLNNMCQRKKKKEKLENILNKIKIKAQHINIYGLQLKQPLEKNV